jgi:hypothetical protein
MSHPVQEEDRIAIGKILLTAVVSLAIFGVGVVWAVSIQRSNMNGTVQQWADPDTAAARREGEVGIVYQWPFNMSHYAQDTAEQTKGRLESYGWVDKNAKVVHIPIDKAMEKYVSTAGAGK